MLTKPGCCCVETSPTRSPQFWQRVTTNVAQMFAATLSQTFDAKSLEV